VVFYSEGLVELAVLIAFLFNFKQLSTTLHTMRLERKACENRNVFLYVKGKGKVFPYSLPSVGPGADPGVQAVSPQVT